MIRHCVFIRFQPSVTDDTISGLMQDIAELRDHLPGIMQLRTGDNVSPELGMDKGFSRGFMIDFASPADRDTYLGDQAHEKNRCQARRCRDQWRRRHLRLRHRDLTP